MMQTKYNIGRGLAGILLGASLAFGGFGAERAYGQSASDMQNTYKILKHTAKTPESKKFNQGAEDFYSLLAIDEANAKAAKEQKERQEMKSLLEKNLQNSQNQSTPQQNYADSTAKTKEQKNEPEILQLKEIASTNDFLLAPVLHLDGSETALFESETLGGYELTKKFVFEKKIDASDKFVKDDYVRKWFKNDAYGYYAVKNPKKTEQKK